MTKSVLALGLDPVHADFSEMPNLSPELIGAFIETQLQRLREMGYDVKSCLVDRGATAETVTAQCLAAKKYDCVVIGAGLHAPQQLLLFERLLNLVHEKARDAKICFNTNPADTAEAVRRWI